jgi:hypothetical protein
MPKTSDQRQIDQMRLEVARERNARLHWQGQCAIMGLYEGRKARGTDAVRRLYQLVH